MQAVDQLKINWKHIKKTVKGENSIKTGFGSPIGNKDAVLTIGKRGPTLLEDVNFLDEMSHFDRERIPERTVHVSVNLEWKSIQFFIGFNFI